MAQTTDYAKYNAEAVLAVVDEYINELEDEKEKRGRAGRLLIKKVYDELSIFDWWNEYLSLTQLQDMQKFLREAIKLGYTGYVCFKVGATGCAKGMWANTEPTTTGYSPNGCAFLYKSFTPAYNYWTAYDKDGNELGMRLGKDCSEAFKTIKDLEQALKEVA